MQLCEGLNYIFGRVCRQCNSLADSFTRLRVLGMNQTWNESSELSPEIRGILRLDNSSLPSLHTMETSHLSCEDDA